MVLLGGVTLVADQAHLVGVHEVEAVGEEDLLVLELDPDQLIHQLVPPLVHNLETLPKLGVEDPQEDEAVVGQLLNLDVGDVAVAHGVVLQAELAVGEHELRVILLGTLDPPRGVDQHHVEGPHLLREKVPIEESHIAIHKCLRRKIMLPLGHLLDLLSLRQEVQVRPRNVLHIVVGVGELLITILFLRVVAASLLALLGWSPAMSTVPPNLLRLLGWVLVFG